MEINVLVDEAFGGQIDTAWLEGLVREVLAGEGVSTGTEMGLVVTTCEEVRELNRSYRNIDEPTDVLSFHMPVATGTEPLAFVSPPDGIVHLGEVIIAYPQAIAQAEEHGHSVRDELALLTVHGTLHLLGYDHEQPGDERRMRGREAEIMGRLGGPE